jgi:hypothetical protein
MQGDDLVFYSANVPIGYKASAIVVCSFSGTRIRSLNKEAKPAAFYFCLQHYKSFDNPVLRGT